MEMRFVQACCTETVSEKWQKLFMKLLKTRRKDMRVRSFCLVLVSTCVEWLCGGLTGLRPMRVVHVLRCVDCVEFVAWEQMWRALREGDWWRESDGDARCSTCGLHDPCDGDYNVVGCND